MPPWLNRVTMTAPLHQTHGTHLPLWAVVMVPQTPGPPQEGKKGEENEWVEGIFNHTMPGSQRAQRMAHKRSSFVLWWTTTKWVLLLCYKYHREGVITPAVICSRFNPSWVIVQKALAHHWFINNHEKWEGLHEKKKINSGRCNWWKDLGFCCLTAHWRWLFKQSRAEMSPSLCGGKACWQAE